MELYEYARPDIMAGKKILFIHGFASSGANGSVKTLRLIYPEAEVIAPDLPVEPHEAMELLQKICSEQEPDLIIGTSMGGMFAEQLYGYDRVLVNPAFSLADNLLKSNSIGRQVFHNERQDGETEFLVTKALVNRYREVCEACFSGVQKISETRNNDETRNDDERGKVYALFGRKDPFVHSYPQFIEYYTNGIYFNGEHYLNDSVFIHGLMPLIQRIDDKQNGHKRTSIVISVDGPLRDRMENKEVSSFFEGVEPVSTSKKAVDMLSQDYDIYVLSDIDQIRCSDLNEIRNWVDYYFGVPVWNHIIFSTHKEMLLADYLIDSAPNKNGGEEFMGTSIHFGSETFRTWEDVLDFFSRLNGQ